MQGYLIKNGCSLKVNKYMSGYMYISLSSLGVYNFCTRSLWMTRQAT